MAPISAAVAAHRRLFLTVFLLGITLFRLYYIQSLPLTEDEAYHWEWSRNLACGYFDQGPVAAWTIRLGTLLFGQTEFGVRFPAVIMGLAISLLMFDLCRRIFNDEELGFWLVILLNGTLLFSAASVIHTYDTPMALFWTLSLWLISTALFKNRPVAWYWAGVTAGLAMLSKYSGVLLPLLTFTFLAVNPRQRFWLKRKEPWLAALIAAVVFSPNLIWNIRRDMVSFVFTLGHSAPAWHPSADEFIGGQAGLIGPIAFVMMMMGWRLAWKNARQGNDVQSFLGWTSAPVLLFFLLFSLKARVYANWPAPAYTGGLAVAALALRDRLTTSVRWRRWGVAALATGYLLVALAHFPGPLLRAFNVGPDQDPTKKMADWPAMGQAIGEVLNNRPESAPPFVFGHRYQKAALAAFYTPGQPRTICLFLPHDRLNTYVFWTLPHTLRGRDGLAVVDAPDDPEDPPALRKLFKSWRLIRIVDLKGASGQVVDRVALYHCQKFKGRDARPPEFLEYAKIGKGRD